MHPVEEHIQSLRRRAAEIRTTTIKAYEETNTLFNSGMENAARKEALANTIEELWFFKQRSLGVAYDSSIAMKSLAGLRRGDLVRPVGNPQSFMIDSTDGLKATAVRTVEITNPSEWVRVASSDYRFLEPGGC